MKKLMSALAAGLLLSAGAASAAPVQWAGNGHWYEIVSAPGMAWADASAAAQAAGGYLATLTSQAENDFVVSLGVGAQPLWLGATQAANATSATDGWQWVTGEAWSFTNWASSEPNNFPAETALAFAFFQPGTWNNAPIDFTGYTNGGYVVEFSVPEPASLALVGLALSGLGLARRKRQG
jgi:hypothetical protein